MAAEGGGGKADVRARLRAARRALSAEDVQARGARAQARLLALPGFQAATTIALYAAQAGEVPTDALLAAALAGGKTVCFPVVPAEGRVLEFRAIRSRSELTPAGRRAIPEPSAASPPVPLASIELFVVPGLGFTRAGHRLGQGGGYYDATLAAAAPRSQRWALAFSEQLLPELPVSPGDAPVDVIVTEAESFPGRARELLW
jgi:5-formyltetrahydrofolate cyclo-ligase